MAPGTAMQTNQIPISRVAEMFTPPSHSTHTFGELMLSLGAVALAAGFSSAANKLPEPNAAAAAPASLAGVGRVADEREHEELGALDIEVQEMNFPDAALAAEVIQAPAGYGDLLAKLNPAVHRLGRRSATIKDVSNWAGFNRGRASRLSNHGPSSQHFVFPQDFNKFFT